MARSAPGPVVLDNNRGTLQLCKNAPFIIQKVVLIFVGYFYFLYAECSSERSTETGNKLVGILLIQTIFLICMTDVQMFGACAIPPELQSRSDQETYMFDQAYLATNFTWHDLKDRKSVYCKAIVLSPVGDEARCAMFEQHGWSRATPERLRLICSVISVP